MNRARWVWLLLGMSFVPTAPLWAEEESSVPPSVFFSDEEVRLIQNEKAAHPHAFVREENRPLKLDSLLYFGPGKWTAWINGEAWTPATHKEVLQILSVTPQTLNFRLPARGAREAIDVVLRVGQSVDSVTGKVQTAGE